MKNSDVRIPKKCSTRLPTLGVGFLCLTVLTVLTGLFYCGVDQRSHAQSFKMVDIKTFVNLMKRFAHQVKRQSSYLSKILSFPGKIFVFNCLWSDTLILAPKNVILGEN